MRVLRLLAALLLFCTVLAADPAAAQNAPGAPLIASAAASANSLAVTWTAPSSDGGSAITRYDLRYIETGASGKDVDANWTLVDGIWSSGALSYTVSGLYDATGYDVQVRAANSAPGPWSASFTQTTLDHGGQFSAATVLPLGSSLPGNAASSTDADHFSITVDEFTYLWAYTTGDADTVGFLYTSDGTVVGADDDGLFLEGPFNFSIRARLDAGTYYMSVIRKDSSPTGRYRLHAQAVADPGNSLATATPITIDSVTPGMVGDGSAGTDDVFKLVLDEPTDVWFMAYGETQTRVVLLNSAGVRIDSANGFFTSRRFDLSYQDRSGVILGDENGPLAAGTYYIRVERFFDFRVRTLPEGPYLLFVRTIGDPAGSAESAAQLSHFEPQSGRLSTTSDADYFAFTLAEETYLGIEVMDFTFPARHQYPLEVTVLDGDDPVELFTVTSASMYVDGTDTPKSTEVNQLLWGKFAAGTYHVKVRATSADAFTSYLVQTWADRSYAVKEAACTAVPTALSDPWSGCQWHLSNSNQLGEGGGQDINVASVWDADDPASMGDGINVAVIDTSFHHDHEDLRDNADASKNSDSSNFGGLEFFDAAATHGTEVAGLIAARDNGLGVRGVAPRATIYGYSVLRGSGHNVDEARRVEAAAHQRAVTAVYNNSWGNGQSEKPKTVSAAWELAVAEGVKSGYGGKGSFYTWGAGNGYLHGDDVNLDEMKNYYAVTSVCAVNYNDVRARYSDVGAALWICAPSGDKKRGLPGITTTTNARYTDAFTGTSAATPIVSGVAALIRAANPALSWRDVKLILAGSARKNDAANSGWQQGATKYGGDGNYLYNPEYGFGVVDAGAAVSLAKEWTNLPAMVEQSATAADQQLAITDRSSDSQPVPVTSTVTLGSEVGFIEFVELNTEWDHDAIRDLKIELISPAGTVSLILPSRPAPPEWPLDISYRSAYRFGSAQFLGEAAQGEWSLRITDESPGGGGTLESWSLKVYGHSSSTSAAGVPVVSSALALTAAEGTTAVATLTATDSDTAEGDLVWSIPSGVAGGADGSKFSISEAGALAFAAVKDYETPDDAGSDGVYDVTVQVSDGTNDATAELTVTLTDVNEAPTADAGDDQEVVQGAAVTLSGSGSDPDAGDTDSSYQWSQTSGDTVVLSGADTATATFTAPTGLTENADLVFRLQVSDDEGLNHQDEVTVTVKAGPTARFEQVPSNHGSSTFQFRLHFSEEVVLSYLDFSRSLFEITGGTVLNARRLAPPSNIGWEVDARPDGDGAMVITLLAGRACSASGAVCNSAGDQLAAAASATIPGPAPTVTSPTAIEVEEGSTSVATLTAADADTPVGDLVWSIPSGAGGGADASKFTLSTAGALAFTEAKDFESADDSDNDGTYEVTVRVSDGSRSDTADLQVSLANANEAPTADAGDDQTVEMGATVALAGSGTDPDAGDTLGYAWTQTSGDTVTITDGETATAGFTAPTGLTADAVLGFTLTVTDAGGLAHSDTVTVTVQVQAAAAPAVSSPAAFSVAEGSTSVAALTATDADTPIADLEWSIPAGNDGGADASKFSLSTAGALAFTEAKDFESADDSDNDGTYEVTVKVSDGSRSDTAELEVSLTDVNEAPTADAGDDQTVEMGAAVTLSGSAADPDAGDTLDYAWSQTGGTTVTLSGDDTATATFTAPTGLTADAELEFTLTVTDSDELAHSDTVTVTVAGPAPAAPSVSSASAFTAAEGSTAVATLTATDADTPTGDLVWSIPSGAEGGADAAKFSLTAGGVLSLVDAKDFEAPDDADEDGTYEVTVKVSDGANSDTADVQVSLANVNEAPVADAGDDQTVAMGASVTLSGSGSDPDAGDTLGYAWSQTSGDTVTLTNAATATAGFTAPTGLSSDTELSFTLTVTDAGGLTDTDTVTVTVTVADAVTASAEEVPDRHSGSGRFSFELAFSEEVELGYEAVRDDLFEVTGGSVEYVRRHAPPSNVRWIINVEPSSNSDVVLVLAAGRACGTTGAVCTDDNRKLSNRLEITVPGPNTPNIGSAAAFTVAEGTTSVATLTATDADTPTADLVWSIAGGADRGEFSLSGAGVLSFTDAKDFESPDDSDKDGVYEVTVKVSDGANSDTADIEVTVSNVNEAPAAEAGDNQNSVAMGATVTLSGSGNDPDAGDTLGYAWSQTSGATVALSGGETATAAFTAPTGLTADAVLVFTLTVTDAGGLSDADTVAITVKGVPPKPPEIATAATLTATEGSETVATLTATDADTAAADLVWSIPSGAAGGADRAKFTLSAAGVLSFTAAKDFESPDDSGSDGVYEVTVKVFDGSLSDTADLQVTLTNVNEAPTADAGDNQTVEMGATVTLSGSGSDPDSGDTLGYAWTQTSGQTVTLANAATTTAGFTAPTGLTADAVLVFTLTVTDSDELAHSDTVTVTVAGPPPVAPEITTAAALTAAEGSETVATLTATDADTAAADLVWSIPSGAAGGADRAKFTLSAAGVLSFTAAKDFESPDDSGSDGVYEVTVKVSDGELSDTADLQVTLANVNEAPVADAGDSQTVEMGATVTLSGSGTDPDSGDTLGYAWSQTSGQTVTLTGANTATATFTAPTGLTADAVLVFTLTVSDAGGLTGAETVTVTVQGPAPEHEWGERLSDRDISLGDVSSPTGLWSDGIDVWVITDADSGEISVYALADGTEHTARGYTLSGRGGFLTALWSDGTTIWVSGFDGDVLAYRLSDGTRQSSRDLDSAALAAAGNTLPTGLWSDGTTMWVADYAARRVFAYDLATKARDTSRELALEKQAGVSYGPFGIWSDGTTMWVAVWAGREVLAHDLESGQRQPDKDISTTPSRTRYPNGVWSNGPITWVLDDEAKTVYAYATPA